jgi:hypothetical protein
VFTASLSYSILHPDGRSSSSRSPARQSHITLVASHLILTTADTLTRLGRKTSAMPKRNADEMARWSPTDPNHPWVSRGYRPEYAYSIRGAPIEDEYGEVAYQRALFDAAMRHSRRVPDAQLYHNSESAREYIRRKNKSIFGDPSPTGNSQVKTITQPNTPSSTTTSNYSPGQLPSPINTSRPNLPPARPGLKLDLESVNSTSIQSSNNRHVPQVSPKPIRQPVDSYRPYAPHGIPLTLEPKLDAPTGPSRMIR